MIARVFPSKTNATPTDEWAFVGEPIAPVHAADRVLISVTFSWDIPEARRLEKFYRQVCKCPVEIGGPAMGDRGGEFEPGLFLAPGYVITSRGCPNRCWFCDVPRREGGIRELPVTEGWNVLDSNLLACSESHQDRVFEMLSWQKHRPIFTGGLEPKRITTVVARKLRAIKTDRIFCAYDTPEDLPHLQESGKILMEAGFSKKHHLSAYVLCGFPKDTPEEAEKRFRETWYAGFMPMAMRWKDPNEFDWNKFCRNWIRPAIARKLLNK